MLCALGFHRPIEMAKLWLQSGYTSVGTPDAWHEIGVLRCERCGAEMEDGRGYTTTSWRTLPR